MVLFPYLRCYLVHGFEAVLMLTCAEEKKAVSEADLRVSPF